MKIHIRGSMCAPASTSKSCRKGFPRRMPCEKNTQVAGTLLPQDKEGYGSDISHEENVIFIFEESRTLHSIQLFNEEDKQDAPKATIF
ncbi:hypothetical protein [Bacillus sp. NEB1478]|uniref:hypothetical protein n=1 Tax=Bacillus sp. NEB1478 TaxID=3073816 RepID=UPI00287369B5|nr:hypothetical protein [Bacillus sp. NEB1478]WNB92360.1 hypothetical protein RGB74_01470 [Bacillus sp. NEB1478]